MFAVSKNLQALIQTPSKLPAIPAYNPHFRGVYVQAVWPGMVPQRGGYERRDLAREGGGNTRERPPMRESC